MLFTIHYIWKHVYSQGPHGPFQFCYVQSCLVHVLLNLQWISRQASVNGIHFIAFSPRGSRRVTVNGHGAVRRAAFYYGLAQRARPWREAKSAARQRRSPSAMSSATERSKRKRVPPPPRGVEEQARGGLMTLCCPMQPLARSRNPRKRLLEGLPGPSPASQQSDRCR